MMTLTLAMPVSVSAQSSKNSGKAVSAILEQYRKSEGFEYIKIGAVATSALRTMMKANAATSGDKDARRTLRLFDGVKNLTVSDFSDCSSRVKSEITRKLDSALASYDVLIELKDGKDGAVLYGLVDDATSKMEDLLIYAPSEDAIICFFGTFKTDDIAAILSESTR